MSLYTLYLDDSKWGGSDNKPKYMVWGGFIIEESVEDKLINKIFKLKKLHKLNPYDPIKFNPPNKPEYSAQRNIKQQNDFRKKVVSLIATSKVTLLAAYYDRTKKLDFTGMASQLINDLSVRFEFFIKSKKTPHKNRGSIILSYPGEKEALPFSKKYYDIRKNEATLHSKNWHSPDAVPIKLSHLEHSVYFSFESHNPLIQIADYVAGSVAFALKGKNSEYFYILKPCFRAMNKNIKGTGIISYPHYTTEIDRLCKR